MSGFYVFYFYSSNVVVVVILPSCLPTECTMYSTLVSANCFKCAFIDTFDLLLTLLHPCSIDSDTMILFLLTNVLIVSRFG